MTSKAQRLRDARNSPPQDTPWIWLTREMVGSDALRSLSRAARLVVDRITLEHMAHAGTENGNLIVTFDDFVKFGIRRHALSKAIKEATQRGLILVTQKGRASKGPQRFPTHYALGWLPMRDGTAALNRWKAWRQARPRRSPPSQDIESSTAFDTRENGRNAGSLVTDTTLASSVESGTGNLAETHNSPVPETTPGKMNSAAA